MPPTKSTEARTLEFVVIADLDKNSKDASSPSTFVSFLQHGTLTIAQSPATNRRPVFRVTWGTKQRLTTTLNDGDRGFELSELAWFQGKLLTFDDRTGVVFQLAGFQGGGKASTLQAIPQHTITAGDGDDAAPKGQKHEWATVKDGELYMGSNGLTTTEKHDTMLQRANEWIAVVDAENTVRRVDWAIPYARVREALGVTDAGYVTHEAVAWSAIHNKWFLLPRRVSYEPFNATRDAHCGANKLVIASDDFTQLQVVEIRGGVATPERGFSSFKFVPNTDDRMLVAIKSVEVGDTQASYVTVLDVDGTVLLDDVALPDGHKYEGVAFAHDWASGDADELEQASARCCVPWW